jgi:hypothetical protein
MAASAPRHFDPHASSEKFRLDRWAAKWFRAAAQINVQEGDGAQGRNQALSTTICNC